MAVRNARSSAPRSKKKQAGKRLRGRRAGTAGGAAKGGKRVTKRKANGKGQPHKPTKKAAPKKGQARKPTKKATATRSRQPQSSDSVPTSARGDSAFASSQVAQPSSDTRATSGGDAAERRIPATLPIPRSTFFF